MLNQLYLLGMEILAVLSLGIIGILKEVYHFVISPLGQIVLWGMATFVACGYTAFKMMTLRWDHSEEYQGEVSNRTGFALIITVFWMVNIFMWYNSAVSLMIFTDILFVILAGAFHWVARQRWSFDMFVLYLIAFFFDILLVRGMLENTYSWWSNGVYTLQLITISGISRNLRSPLHLHDRGAIIGRRISAAVSHITTRLKNLRGSSSTKQNLSL